MTTSRSADELRALLGALPEPERLRALELLDQALEEAGERAVRFAQGQAMASSRLAAIAGKFPARE